MSVLFPPLNTNKLNPSFNKLVVKTCFTIILSNTEGKRKKKRERELVSNTYQMHLRILWKKKKKNINWKIAIKLIKDNYYLCLQISWEYVSPLTFRFSHEPCAVVGKKEKKGPKVKHYWWEIKSEESSTAHSHWPQLASQMPITICLIVQVPSPRNASPLHYIFTTRPSHFRTPACPFNSTAALEGWLILHAIIYIVIL